MYTFRLFGTPTVEGPEGPVSGRVTQKRQLALLAVLARAERRTMTRDRLMAMFCPESSSKRARHSIADAVWVVRNELGASSSPEPCATPGGVPSSWPR
ncbi:MAG: hypothetical protein R3304_05155 [Longimicrobiales bacterium]|nr:hypothetical protein [Longimicrobiales bacterium]